MKKMQPSSRQVARPGGWQNSGVSELLVPDTTGVGFSIIKTQDCENIIKAIGELPDHAKRRLYNKSNQRLLGTVPNILAVSWAKEWGVRLYGKEWLEKAAKRLRHDPEWSKLKVQY